MELKLMNFGVFWNKPLLFLPYAH